MEENKPMTRRQRQAAFLAWMEQHPVFFVGDYQVEVEWEREDEAMEDGRLSEDF